MEDAIHGSIALRENSTLGGMLTATGFSEGCRATLDGAAEGGCPHIPVNLMVAPEGLEPPTLSSED